MAKRNFTEFGINMNLSRMMMYQQAYYDEENFNSYFDRNNPSHIYFIGKRPKITMELSNFEVTKEYIILPFKIQIKEDYIDFPIKRSNPFGHSNVKLESTYPYSEFFLYENGKVKLEGLVSVYLQELSRSMEPIQYLDFEVLYIGQSYGKDGNRQSPDRLKSHSTLQGIYAEAMTNNPDSDIYIALASFEEIIITSFDRTKKMELNDYKIDKDRFLDINDKLINNYISEQQKINFTEAALIKYFQPPYNKIYKDSFPNPSHSTYSECYDLDINSVMIELQIQNMVNCNFYTTNCPPKYIHIGKFLLHSYEDRKSLFEFSYEK